MVLMGEAVSFFFLSICILLQEAQEFPVPALFLPFAWFALLSGIRCFFFLLCPPLSLRGSSRRHRGSDRLDLQDSMLLLIITACSIDGVQGHCLREIPWLFWFFFQTVGSDRAEYTFFSLLGRRKEGCA